MKKRRIRICIVKRLIYLGILAVLLVTGLVFTFCFKNEISIAGILITLTSLIGVGINSAELIVILVRSPKKGKRNAPEIPAPDGVTPYLRITGPAFRGKTLLEATVESYHIAYRRTGRTNELVVNGRVYDEWKGLIETEHELHAAIDGNAVAAGLDRDSFAYIEFNEERIAQTLRSV